ncbi:SprT family protein [Isobaculum melis]|uniref:Protein SprT-like n=1 Tax=Isobaculum melis TaxID=142588 RepID=A0A1H9TXT9_9LACT|nr:SprT family protein [Isobaculum melis]SES02055.1 SprT-like protein [Isobaculum melis]
MKKETLQQLVEEISLASFGRPFKHQATFNKRLKTTGGRYHLQSHHLDFNPKVYEKYGQDELVKVIKHELCHYHLHLLGQGYQHKDRDFKVLLQRVGGSRYVQPLTEAQPKSTTLWAYQCTKCGVEVRRKRRFDVKRYVCGSCQGKLVLKGRIS